MCVQYCGVLSSVGDVQYRGGYTTNVGDILSTVGVTLDTVEDTQYHGGYHEYHGVSTTVGDTVLCNLDIMIHVEDIMSTMGVLSVVEVLR